MNRNVKGHPMRPTSSRPRRRTRRLTAPLIAGTAALVLVLVTACSATPDTDTEAATATTTPAIGQCDSTRLRGFPTVDAGCDPDSVLTAAAAIVFSYRPAEHLGQADSFAAAQPLMTPDYVQSVGVSASALAPITGAQWAQWAADSSVVTATAVITAADHPADTDTRHLRVLTVTQHVTGQAGAAAGPDPAPLTVYMGAQKITPPTRASTGPVARIWAVDTISIR